MKPTLKNKKSSSFKRLRKRILSPSSLAKSKRGISSVFLAVYVSILSVLLITVLFFGLSMSNQGLSQYMRLDQEKMQEDIQLYKITSDSTDTYITSLQVVNTGSITVKLRALYIDRTFICDPSDLSILGENAYIEPKENVSIPLFPNIYLILDAVNLNAQWTVTTERGTHSSERGINLWKYTGGSAYTPDKFYFGPLMLSFDMFHWKSGNGPWIPGWSVPIKTNDVTWRISLTNIDTKKITLMEQTSFSLIGNTNLDQKQVWYIDPEDSDMTLEPGELRSIYYKWSKPVTQQGASLQSIGEFSAEITCKNFLVFTGYFTEANGTLTPFGQTIPFEAVLITDENMPTSITLTANPVNIKNDGISSSTITATVRDSKGNPVPDVWVDLYTTAGQLSENHVKTNANGQLQVNLVSTRQQTTATIYAICKGITGTCKVNFTPATKLSVAADPSRISENAANSTITVQLQTDDGTNVAQSGISVTVTLTWSGTSQTKPLLTYQQQTVTSPVTVTTDSNGRAILTLTSKNGVGTATITAAANQLASGTTNIQVVLGANSVEVVANPKNIANNAIASSIISATVKDRNGQPLANTLVTFATTAGTLSSTSSLTDANGVAQVQLTSSTNPETATVTATCQGKTGTTKINFTPATKISVTANPTSLTKQITTSTITVQLQKDDGTNVAQSGINIQVTLSWDGGSQAPTLSVTSVTTDSNGQATLTITRGNKAGTATITASSSGLTSGSIIIPVTV